MRRIVENGGALKRTINALEKRFHALPEALDRLAHEIEDRYRSNINAGRGGSASFRALSEPYATQKAKKYGARPILVASGAMVAAFGHRVLTLAEAHYRLEIGASGSDGKGVRNVDKAIWHIEGTDRMPSRDFTFLPKGFVLRSLSATLKQVAGRTTVAA